jgi:nitroreductase
MNAVIDTIMNHRSIRKFQNRPIEPDRLNLILEAGTRAANASNLQRYSLIVVDDPLKKRQIRDDAMVDNPIMIIAVVDEYRIKRWLELNGAPFYYDKVFHLLLACWDANLALQNIILAAESLGLGTVCIGGILHRDLHAILGVPQYVFPAGMILLGYPDESPERRSRLPLEAVVHHNAYHIPTDEEIREYFKEKDALWEKLSEEERSEYMQRGITNWAQRIALGGYRPDLIRQDQENILRYLKEAGFKLNLE